MTSHSNTKLSPIAKAVRGSIVCLGLAHNVSQAATIVVTSNGDSGGAGCEFREAIEAINLRSNNAGCNNVSPTGFGVNDFILFNPNVMAGNTITLFSSEIAINRNVIIEGFEGLTLDSAHFSGFLRIETAFVLLSNLTINGFVTNEDREHIIDSNNSSFVIRNSTISGNTTNGAGGAIVHSNSSSVLIDNTTINGNTLINRGSIVESDNSSYITINDTIISGNSTNGSIIFSEDYYDDMSTITIDNTTISGNSSGNSASSNISNIIHFQKASITISNTTISANITNASRGRIISSYASTITLDNTTISSNTTNGDGDIIFALSSSITFNNSTINNNTPRTLGDDGLRFRSSVLNLNNSIIANSSSSAGSDCNIETGVLSIDTSTIIQDGSCNTQRAIDPQLGPLADNGGATLTHALLPNSLARNTGILATCETLDQRGQTRDDGDGACDVGAIEFNPDDNFGEDESFYVIPLADGKTIVIPL